MMFIPTISPVLFKALSFGFTIALLITWGMQKIALLDKPTKNRSSHKTPTPTSGGIGFISGTIGALLYIQYSSPQDILPYTFWIIIGALILAIVGFLDDLKEISFKKRLIAQLCVASLLDFSINNWPQDFAWCTGICIGLVILLSGFINATNFCDGLNGLLGTGMMLVTLFLGLSIPHLAYVYLPLSAGLLAFLIFNWRGKIFMGDVGSFFLGLTVPGALLLTSDLLAHILLLGHFFFMYILDISITIARRLFLKKSVVTPHQDFHFHHLHKMGLPHLGVTFIYGTFTLLQGVMYYLMTIENLWDFAYLYVFDAAIYLSLFQVIYTLSQRFEKLGLNLEK